MRAQCRSVKTMVEIAIKAIEIDSERMQGVAPRSVEK